MLTAGCFVLAYFLKKHHLPEPLRGLTQEPSYYVILLLVIIIWYLSLNTIWAYKDPRKSGAATQIWDVIRANGLALLILSFVLYATKMPVSRLMIGIFFVLDVAALSIFRVVAAMAVKKMDTSDLSATNVVIVGSRERAMDVVRGIENHYRNNVHILGCFDPDSERVGMLVGGKYPVRGTMDALEPFLRENVVDELIVAMPIKKIPSGDRCLATAEEMGITARIVPDWQLHHLAYQPIVASIFVSPFYGVQTLALMSVPKNQGKLFLKSVFDYTAAAVLVVICLPIFLGAALAIKASSKGPVFYRQQRLGKNGRRFDMLKFRTMQDGADKHLDEVRQLNECDGPVFKIRKDPRIIPVVGSVLRKSSIDELPQLFNVLRGEMSLVGPRPPIPSEVNEYETWQRRRLSMKPGITCLWQVEPCRNDLPFCKWVEMDLAYIDQWSLRLDFLILFKTVRAVLSGAGR
jgi:exopolysaccharide biosynthesis polyprenyl glycosylphosphotransferase